MSNQPKDLLTQFLLDTVKSASKWTATRVARAAGYQPVGDKQGVTVDTQQDTENNGLNADMKAIMNAFGPFIGGPIEALSATMVARKSSIKSRMEFLTTTSNSIVNGVVQEANKFLKDPKVNEILAEFVGANKQILITMSPLLEEVIEQMITNGVSSATQIAIAMVNITFDSLAAVPGFGSLINMAKIGNNVTFMMLQLVMNAKNMLVISSLFLDKFRKVMHAAQVSGNSPALNAFAPLASSAYNTVSGEIKSGYGKASEDAKKAYADVNEKAAKAYNTLKTDVAPKAAETYDKLSRVATDVAVPLAKEAVKYAANNVASFRGSQSGGALREQRRAIEKRINKSLREFTDPMNVKRKTRRRRRK